LPAETQRRNYSIIGPETQLAHERGLVEAEWYISPIPREKLKELMKRKDGPAIRDTLIWFAALIGSGFLAYYSWGTWWAVPAFALYGIIYITAADSRWHECAHGTPFKTIWMNETLYQLCALLALKTATPWRWSHVRHHTDTIVVGRDPEIIAPRPPVWRILLGEIFRLYFGPREFQRTVMHCFGKLSPEEESYVPKSEHWKVFWESRITMLIYLGLIAWCFSIGSILPAMFVFLPTLYGSILILLFVIVQHLGLKEDVLDHRLNTRTVYMNPVYRFLYWNMNYHIEHHMFPMVPYHALPGLHELMKFDTPEPTRGVWAALKEVIPALIKQHKDPTYSIVRPLPGTANPYKFGPYS
jgi:fatty acid desaturase